MPGRPTRFAKPRARDLMRTAGGERATALIGIGKSTQTRRNAEVFDAGAFREDILRIIPRR